MRVYLDLVPTGNERSHPIVLSKNFPTISPFTNVNISSLYQSMISHLQENPPFILQGTTTNFQLIAMRYSIANPESSNMCTVRLPFLGNPRSLPQPMPLNGEHIVSFLTRYEIINPSN